MHLNQLTLFITKSPEEYTGSKHIEMPESGGSLGRNPSNTVSLVDHNRFISGSHCLISIYGDTYYLSDVSTNGTLVNGNKLLKNQPISLYDGDTIVLGRYEISVGLEKLSNSINIAADISEETDSTDPLVNLAEYTPNEEQDKGNIADLFKETRIDKVDSSDPVAHLNFITQTNNDEHLLHGNEKKHEQKINEPIHTRQLLDDSDSVHSEFDIPNLIPEDWFSDDFSNSLNSTPSINEEIGSAPSIPDPIVQPAVELTPEPVVSPVSEQQSWEDVTQTIQTSSSTIESTNDDFFAASSMSTDVYSSPMQSIEAPYSSKTEDAKNAFYKGLGMSAAQIEQTDEQFFQQMGNCLRLCINNLQKELSELKAIKNNEQDDSMTNIVELMLSLNHQQLLSPNELIEQILDELDNHKLNMTHATNDVINNKLLMLHPEKFAQDIRSQSRFKASGKLWKEYIEFYQNHNNEKIDISSSVVQQKIKEQYTKRLKA
ncbi:type VI secretion system-associated FHA domain protein TagH [Aliivibrio fischeri]|uniref:type VI secretion system-associated FHA domain protein TagH n=1 Tax=Aliivibrio fischeri TaxID=668 RepID=UPI0007C569C2|nr:type VI secretion system-associated FHA domain protein TagH [Aliivibrio fischeri]MBP3140087.1 type VI secretion system-associated FHA domain protein TagH [Aliivibrio fischeri]MBP3154468.1 type VI secretion system-associated FHA domain protein TagH [Aliivibrio fischeri]MCE7572210.1 type VI secretion system-associated FHA domain protein TagH [Aliivibrio fischeri]